jgi:hypothetical protein
MPNGAYLFHRQVGKLALNSVGPIVTKVDVRPTQYMDHGFLVHVVRPSDAFLSGRGLLGKFVTSRSGCLLLARGSLCVGFALSGRWGGGGCFRHGVLVATRRHEQEVTLDQRPCHSL